MGSSRSDSHSDRLYFQWSIRRGPKIMTTNNQGNQKKRSWVSQIIRKTISISRPSKEDEFATQPSYLYKKRMSLPSINTGSSSTRKYQRKASEVPPPEFWW